MGSRLHLQQAHVALLIVTAMAMMGCPQPNLHVEFEQPSRHAYSKTYQTMLLDSKLKLTIDSFSFISPDCNRYLLSLSIKSEYDDLVGHVEYDPYVIRILVGGKEMSKDRHYIDPQSDTTSMSDYSLGVKFRLEDNDLGFTGSGSTPIRIIMDGFIFYDGEPVHIDTVRAVERKHCSSQRFER